MRAFRRLVPVLAVLLVVSACDDSGTSPSDASTVVISTPSPAAASAVVTAVGTPPGVFIARGSGQVSIPITVTTTRDVPWAQLYVYLLTADGYCGQNLPDAPTWGPFPKGQAQQVTISGFQVFRTPCEVTGLRAMLHLRNNGLLTPPTASETIAEATRQVAWTIVR